jgi:succinate dehydrogenase/fumarate reductase flavoprotein subunit
MYEKIVDENPYETPMMIYPAVHYTMGGIWVDYNLANNSPWSYMQLEKPIFLSMVQIDLERLL